MANIKKMLHFDGAAYVPALDCKRLTAQIYRIFGLMQDGAWRTLREIHDATGAPEASASACLRDFRKKQWEYHTIERRRRGEPMKGLWEYRMVAPVKGPLIQAELFQEEK